MNIECTHHIDASEPDPNGAHEYYYEHDIYRFTESDVALVARSYTDEPHEVHFLRLEQAGKVRMLELGDLDTSLFREAKVHLEREGKSEFNWLSEENKGYSRIPTAT